MNQATYTKPDGQTVRRWRLVCVDGRVRITWAVTKRDAAEYAANAGVKVKRITQSASMLVEAK